MRLRTIAATAAAAILSICASPALPQGAADWVPIKNTAELRALYSNTTIKGRDPSGNEFVGYYHPDGRGLVLWKGRRLPRTWNAYNDLVCVKHQGGNDCYTYERSRSDPNRIRSRNVAKKYYLQFTVQPGAPDF